MGYENYTNLRVIEFVKQMFSVRSSLRREDVEAELFATGLTNSARSGSAYRVLKFLLARGFIVQDLSENGLFTKVPEGVA